VPSLEEHPFPAVPFLRRVEHEPGSLEGRPKTVVSDGDTVFLPEQPPEGKGREAGLALGGEDNPALVRGSASRGSPEGSVTR
jgi:hypothetical protein